MDVGIATPAHKKRRNGANGESTKFYDEEIYDFAARRSFPSTPKSHARRQYEKTYEKARSKKSAPSSTKSKSSQCLFSCL